MLPANFQLLTSFRSGLMVRHGTDRQTDNGHRHTTKRLNFLYNLKSFKECTTYDSKAVVGRYAISDDSVRLVLLHATIHSRLRRCRPIWRTMSPHSPTINEVTSDSQDVIAGFCSRRSSCPSGRRSISQSSPFFRAAGAAAAAAAAIRRRVTTETNTAYYRLSLSIRRQKTHARPSCSVLIRLIHSLELAPPPTQL